MQKKKSKKIWSDISMLRAIPNPDKNGFQIRHKNPEVTFEGVYHQPDFATAYITFYPRTTVIELKSLKIYFQQFRNKTISYERLTKVVYDDLKAFYKPTRLRLVMVFRPRGGMETEVTFDSDWKCQGGKEKFKDWVGQGDRW